MKRFCLFLAFLTLGCAPLARAQDAVEQRFQELEKRILAIQENHESLRSQIQQLASKLNELDSKIDEVQRKAEKADNVATPEDLKAMAVKMADKINDVDKRREQDREALIKSIEELGKKATARPPKNDTRKPAGSDAPTAPISDKGFEHTFEKGQTLSAVVSAYRAKGYKVTQEQILKANPDLNPNSIPVGKKIFIPVP